jgi:cytidine deaminase
LDKDDAQIERIVHASSDDDKKHKLYKIKAYVSEINSFCNHCKNKLKEIKEEDNKKDILIIHDKISIFKNTIIKQLIELYNLKK